VDTCLFCKIANRELPGKIVYEDDQSVAFEDINPKAPVHILIIPRRHLVTLLDETEVMTGCSGTSSWWRTSLQGRRVSPSEASGWS
jgi:galactose-1-phosphate uridylyltransferase